MAKGKWAQGIKPRHFRWIIAEKLAVCERPGGYGDSHRRVRRQEEIIWIRENRFSYVVSLITSDHNLHSYDEFGMPWQHWPFSSTADTDIALTQIYRELERLLGAGNTLLLHGEEINDRLAGIIGGYLRFTSMVGNATEAIVIAETLFERQLGPEGRELIASAERITLNPVVLPDPPDDEDEPEPADIEPDRSEDDPPSAD